MGGGQDTGTHRDTETNGGENDAFLQHTCRENETMGSGKEQGGAHAHLAKNNIRYLMISLSSRATGWVRFPTLIILTI